jgi:hypothetical protein
MRIKNLVIWSSGYLVIDWGIEISDQINDQINDQITR